MKAVGAIITVIGVFLFCGNVFGFFRTFPMAGYLTIAFGGFIARQDTK